MNIGGWRKCRAKFERRQRKRIDVIMIYFWWNVWKERNRRTFQQKSLQPRQVALLCKDDIYSSSWQQDPSLVESDFLLLGFRFLKSWSSLMFTCVSRFQGLVWRPVCSSSLVFSVIFSSWEFFILLVVCI